MRKKTRHRIILEEDEWRYRSKGYEGKEIFESEMTYHSPTKNKYAIVTFAPDCYISEPHFHVIDTGTVGNKVNAAYSMITGKFIKHGSVIKPLNSNVIGLMKRMLSYRYENETRWQVIMYYWNTFNKNKKTVKINESTKIPNFSN